MEVGEVLATMKRHLGVAGDDPPFEGLVAGSATMPVTGVATCAAPSLDVLRRAVGLVSLATWLGLGPGVPVPSGDDFVIVGGALARWVSQILPQTRVVPFAQDVPVHTLAAGCGQ